MVEDHSCAPVLPAATVLLVRDAPALEVLMVQRHHQVEFASGALVFPGGKTHGGDHDAGWEARSLGWAQLGPEERALRIAGIREAYEESGILLARHADGAPFRDQARADRARADIAAGRRPFLDLAEALDIRLDLEALTVFARWITPPLTARRYDTWFYVAHVPEGQSAACDGRETVDAEWIEPSEALRLAEAGARRIVFPTRLNLQLLAQAAGAEDAIALARRRKLVTVEPQVEPSPDGPVLTLPKDAGYGDVAELLSRVM
jgi:8-oxo-dGTP pyrophosphatase MutT (NUDIX family)